MGACHVGVYAPMAVLIRKTSLNSPAKWKPGMVVEALRCLLHIEKALRAGWN